MELQTGNVRGPIDSKKASKEPLYRLRWTGLIHGGVEFILALEYTREPELLDILELEYTTEQEEVELRDNGQHLGLEYTSEPELRDSASPQSHGLGAFLP